MPASGNQSQFDPFCVFFVGNEQGSPWNVHYRTVGSCRLALRGFAASDRPNATLGASDGNLSPVLEQRGVFIAHRVGTGIFAPWNRQGWGCTEAKKKNKKKRTGNESCRVDQATLPARGRKVPLECLEFKIMA